MPTLTFNINQNKYDQIANAIDAWNILHPEDYINNADDFAKRCFTTYLTTLLDGYSRRRTREVSEKIASCNVSTWNQIKSLLG